MLKLCGFIIALTTSSMALALDDHHSIEQKMAALKLERMQAEVMIKTMVKSGRLNKDEAVHAGRTIASVKEKDVEVIRAEALESLKSSKSLATK